MYESLRSSPFDVLIATILSQNTSDKNSIRAFDSLFEVYDTPKKLAEAPEEKIADLIKIGGLYAIKSKRIKETACIIDRQYGGNLDSICKMDPEGARTKLLAIEGVGPKTADCVLLFACGKDVIPVDTHVFRVSKRLGIAPQKADHEGVRRALMEKVPEGLRGSTHVALIKLGREICKAQNPQHDKCPLLDKCDYARLIGAYKK